MINYMIIGFKIQEKFTIYRPNENYEIVRICGSKKKLEMLKYMKNGFDIAFANQNKLNIKLV